MARLLAVILFCLAVSAPGFADPLDDLFTAAQTGDMARAEAILAGADSPKLRRDMMWMLGGSHEDLRAFTRDWAGAQPDNPAALTARAWSRYREGFLLRGTDSSANTWPASLAEASPIIREAFDLSDRALKLDPTYLPASDAVIIIGEVSGNMSRSEEEALRILEAAPNRHSLVSAASSVRKDWWGRIGVKTDLCDTYASNLPDAPGYTPEMCVIEAIYIGSSCCTDELQWAIDRVGAYVEEPLMEETVLMAAARNHLAPEAADRLRDRLTAEGRLTVTVALSGRPEIIHLPYEAGADPLTEFDAVKAALDRDLAAAKVAADRDPADTTTLSRLDELYGISTELALREAGYRQIPPPDDILKKYNAVMLKALDDDKDMKARALALVTAAPRSTAALRFAATQLDDHLPDPLDSAVWRQALYSNAVLYSNYRYDIVGEFVIGTKFDRSNIEKMAERGKAPTYKDSVLTKAFDCPYIRALRILEASCKATEMGLDLCFQNVGLSYDAEFVDFDGVLRTAEGHGLCEAERTAPVESLRYEEIDLGL